MTADSPPPASRPSLDTLLGELQQQVEAVIAADRTHPDAESALRLATVSVLHGMLVESRQLNRLTRWLIVVTIAVLLEALIEFVLFLTNLVR